MADTGAQPKELTPAQITAVHAIVAARDVRAAAAACGTPERTLYRWLQSEVFKLAIAEQEALIVDYATRRLLLLQDKAIDVIANVLDDPKAPAGIRLRAALGMLDTSIKLRELRDLEVRLAALEAALLARP